MTDREMEILALIEAEPMITQEVLAQKLGIQRSSVAVHISNLMKKGYIKGKGYIVDKAPYAVVIGGSNMDLIGTPKDKLIQRDSNIGTVEARAGGVGRNIAYNLAQLKVPTYFISAVGQDDFGKKIIEGLNQIGIHTGAMLVHPNIPTSTYLCINNENGDMAMAISQMSIVESINVDVLKSWHKIIEGARILVLDTNLTEEVLDYLLTTYHQKEIYVDPVSTAKAVKIIPHLNNVHFLKPNLLEAELMTGLSMMPGEMEQSYAMRLSQALVEKGVEEVCITLGKDGVVYADRTQRFHKQVKEVSVVNTTGAGDAFFAGYCYSAFLGKSVEQGIEIAMRCAEHQITSPNIALNETIFEF